jgi:translation initiation factor 3 subunit C
MLQSLKKLNPLWRVRGKEIFLETCLISFLIIYEKSSGLADSLIHNFLQVWDLFYESEKVRLMLTRKIQEEALRTYLFTYSKVYDSISVETLSELFELDKSTVHAIVSKMIINEELMASLDEPTECMVMHRTEPSRLQSLSLQLSDKISQMVDNNERLLEFRGGESGLETF